ncbi:MAG: hypothetical protein HZB65_02535 [Candidatus Aenigmarchaeota archaeon]|nr:hypothetical protein [Candidatus Aenigmarchaeota archaeon]
MIDGKIIAVVAGFILGLLYLIPMDKTLLFGITIVALLAALGALYYTKLVNKNNALLGVLAYFTIIIILIFYIVPGYAVSYGQGTVLDNNWWNALNWIKENTDECSVVATYWDPGHFIVSIADRPVVFDGAGQNVLFTRQTSSTLNGLVLEEYDNGITQIKKYENGNLTTARIKDIGISLLTSNETLAYDIIKQYNKPGCKEMYYIASSDLVYKSQWWSYFATWDPLKNDPKGTAYNYIPIQMARKKPLFSYGTVGYEYPVSERQSFVIYQQNDSYRALFQQDNQFVRVQKIAYPSGNGFVVYEEPDAEIKGTIYAADPSFSVIFFISPQLENAMFTRMYLYNGAGLEKFKLVKNWGDEVKLYKIEINDNTQAPMPVKTITDTNITDFSGLIGNITG